MKHRYLLSCALALLVLAGGLAVLSGCATTGDTASVSDPDRALAQLVMNRLAQDLMLERASLSATCSGGVVTLRGLVRNESQRARALGIARATSGVTSVVDHLRVF